MKRHLLALILGGAAIAVMTGCAPSADLNQKDQSTLKDNLEKPVDVEKIRAEYAKEKGSGQAGAATDKQGM